MSDPYRIRSADIWARARDDYLAGVTAEEVCDRYDLGLSALRARARRDHWRRTDAPVPEPSLDDLPGIEAALGPSELADLCMGRVVRAIDRNRAAEALRWMRVHAALVAHARSQRSPATDQAPAEVHECARNNCLEADPAPPGPLNRFQRRRQAARARLTGAQSP